MKNLVSSLPQYRCAAIAWLCLVLTQGIVLEVKEDILCMVVVVYSLLLPHYA